jgi:hypothetical protein
LYDPRCSDGFEVAPLPTDDALADVSVDDSPAHAPSSSAALMVYQSGLVLCESDSCRMTRIPIVGRREATVSSNHECVSYPADLRRFGGLVDGEQVLDLVGFEPERHWSNDFGEDGDVVKLGDGAFDSEPLLGCPGT